MEQSEFQRRYNLARKWYERARTFRLRHFERYGIRDMGELSDHPQCSYIIFKVLDELLHKHPQWYFIWKLIDIKGYPYEEIVRELPEAFWHREHEGGDKGEE